MVLQFLIWLLENVPIVVFGGGVEGPSLVKGVGCEEVRVWGGDDLRQRRKEDMSVTVNNPSTSRTDVVKGMLSGCVRKLL